MLQGEQRLSRQLGLILRALLRRVERQDASQLLEPQHHGGQKSSPWIPGWPQEVENIRMPDSQLEKRGLQWKWPVQAVQWVSVEWNQDHTLNPSPVTKGFEI